MGDIFAACQGNGARDNFHPGVKPPLDNKLAAKSGVVRSNYVYWHW
ncbi:MAG TPA: hypothetical protein PLM07_14960 [Candidatus Rifleibacterium sp.]|nr:hypothetical protein [Candidatus Rifleibacterium sp.]